MTTQRHFLRADQGAATVEFAIVATLYFAILGAAIDVGVKALMQAALDQEAFRFSVTLSRQSDVNVSKDDYKENVICNNLSAPLSCNKILFGADAFDSEERLATKDAWNFVTRWNTGCAGSTVIVEMRYPVQDFFSPLVVGDVVTSNGRRFFRSRGVIRREPLVAGTGTHSGGAPC